MQSRVTLALALICLFLSGVYFLYVVPERNRELREKDLRESFFTVSPKEVEFVTLVNPDGIYDLKRDENGKWHLTAPKRLKADQAVVARMLNVLRGERIIKMVSKDTSRLSDFGLLRPYIKARLHSKDSKAEILIGRPNPTRGGAYLYKTGADGVFMVPLEVPRALNLDLFGLRKKEPLDFDPQKVSGLEILMSNSSLRIKEEEGQWVLKEGGRCSKSAVMSFLSELAEARADSFSDFEVFKEPESFLDKAVIEISLQDSAPLEVYAYYLGTGQNEGLALWQKGLPFTGSTDRVVWNLIKRGKDAYRYKNLFELTPSEVYSIYLSTLEGAVTLQRHNGGWRTLEGNLIDSTNVGLVLDTLNAMEADKLISGKISAGQLAWFELEFRNKEGGQIGGLKVFGQYDRAGEPPVFDSDGRELEFFYAKCQNLPEACIVTNLQVETLGVLIQGLAKQGKSHKDKEGEKL